jgi:hypothetical protein
MEAKIRSEMKTIQEKMGAYQEMMDDGHEEMKVQVGFLASRIDVNQEEMIADSDIHHENDSQDVCLDRRDGDMCRKIGGQSRNVGSRSGASGGP